jgi:acyl-CoA synthetase (AMP-forming)/AMP-acid ligase II
LHHVRDHNRVGRELAKNTANGVSLGHAVILILMVLYLAGLLAERINARLPALTPNPGDRDHAERFGFGAGVGRRHHAEFEQRFGFPLLEAWSMTETGAGAVAIVNREPRHAGTNCAGRPSASVEIRITPNDGELLVRSTGPDPRTGFSPNT